MDINSAASDLRQQLITLQQSDRTVSVLDKELSRINEQCIMTSLEDNQSKHLCLLLRQSITDGVYKMYQQYSTNKWNQIQQTALSIKSQLESTTENAMTSPTISSTVRPQSDRTIEQWSSVFCELSRHE
ncbi:hypothetical protein ACF0H5_001676 [Mactra antiquata]